MKKLLSLLILAVLPLQAQDITAATTSTTPVSLLSGRYVVHQLTLTATTAAATTFKFYDTTGTSTNVVQAQYTKPLTYSTNWTTVHTNDTGFVITNTFTGTYVTSETVNAATNQRPALWTIVVPASASRTIDARDRLLTRGLLVYSSAAGVAEVEYTKNQ